MKTIRASKLLCCLLAVLFLAGCGQSGWFAGTTPTVTPGPPGEDYAVVELSLKREESSRQSLVNAEGKELYWEPVPTEWGNHFEKPEGNMGFYDYKIRPFSSAGTEPIVTVPYSESFTAQPGWSFDISFYREDTLQNSIDVHGTSQGTVTIYADNSVQLSEYNPAGKYSQIYITFYDENTHCSYQLDGMVSDYAQIRLVDDEVIAKGMYRYYAVDKYDSTAKGMDKEQRDDHRLYHRIYSADGQLLSEKKK